MTDSIACRYVASDNVSGWRKFYRLDLAATSWEHLDLIQPERQKRCSAGNRNLNPFEFLTIFELPEYTEVQIVLHIEYALLAVLELNG